MEVDEGDEQVVEPKTREVDPDVMARFAQVKDKI